MTSLRKPCLQQELELGWRRESERERTSEHDAALSERRPYRLLERPCESGRGEEKCEMEMNGGGKRQCVTVSCLR